MLPSIARAAKTLPPAAMLVPLSGEHAALGRSMARAALLVQAADAKALIVIDSAGPGGAEAAARSALKRNAGLILGPLFAGEVRRVVAIAGAGVPVITFSNDATLLDSGAFLLGITADQAVAPLLAYARGRGVRQITLAGGTDPWSSQVTAAAARAAVRNGLQLADDAPDALLATSLSDTRIAPARAAGLQVLIPFAGLDRLAGVPGLDGAWLSTPDPAAFQLFATAYEAANGSLPGLIAGLARDAVAIAAALRRGGGSDRSALLGQSSFDGVCGAVRFRTDGSATRTMAILAAVDGGYRVIDRASSL